MRTNNQNNNNTRTRHNRRQARPNHAPLNRIVYTPVNQPQQNLVQQIQVFVPVQVPVAVPVLVGHEVLVNALDTAQKTVVYQHNIAQESQEQTKIAKEQAKIARQSANQLEIALQQEKAKNAELMQKIGERSSSAIPASSVNTVNHELTETLKGGLGLIENSSQEDIQKLSEQFKTLNTHSVGESVTDNPVNATKEQVKKPLSPEEKAERRKRQKEAHKAKQEEKKRLEEEEKAETKLNLKPAPVAAKQEEKIPEPIVQNTEINKEESNLISPQKIKKQKAKKKKVKKLNDIDEILKVAQELDKVAKQKEKKEILKYLDTERLWIPTYLVHEVKSMRKMLNNYELLNIQDRDGDTILHLSMNEGGGNNTKEIIDMVKTLSPEERNNVFNIKNKADEKPIYYPFITQRLDYLKEVLEVLTEEQLKTLLQATDEQMVRLKECLNNNNDDDYKSLCKEIVENLDSKGNAR